MGEQVVPSPTTRKINMREGYILFWKLEGKSKISAGTLFANKTLWCYCYCCCCCHYACKAKMPSNGLVITGTVYILKNRETALKILVLFLLRHVGVEVSQCLRCFLEPRAFPTWVSWQTPLPRAIPWTEVSFPDEKMNVSLMPSGRVLALINHFSLRYVYLGLTLVLGTVSIFFSVAVLWVLRKKPSPQDETLSANGERGACGTKSRKDNFVNSDQLIQSTYWPEKETRL